MEHATYISGCLFVFQENLLPQNDTSNAMVRVEHFYEYADRHLPASLLLNDEARRVMDVVDSWLPGWGLAR